MINEHLDVVLEDDGKTHVYIDGKQFIQCIRLVLVIPLDDSPIDVTSIDDAAEKFGTIYEGKGFEPALYELAIDPETEFIGHCSNLEAWIEHDYDTHLLHSNISFPLLKELSKLGDNKATQVLQADIEDRLRTGTVSTRKAILMTCYDLLGLKHIEAIIEHFTLGDKLQVLHSLGDFLLEKENLPDAIKVYRDILMIDDYDVEAWCNLGLAYWQLNSLSRAIKAYQKALDIAPENVHILLDLGRILEDSEDLKGAINLFQRAIDIDGHDGHSWYSLGHALSAAGNFSAAIKAFRTACHLEPFNRITRDELGIAYLKSGDIKSAVEIFQQEIVRDPTDDFAWYNLGLTFEASDNVLAAIDAYRKAVVIDPGSIESKNALCLALEKAGDWHAAIDVYWQIIAIKPNYARAWNKLSDALAIVESIDESLDSARHAIILAPQIGNYWTQYGILLELKGKFRDAKHVYRIALNVDPNEKRAKKNLAALKKSHL